MYRLVPNVLLVLLLVFLIPIYLANPTPEVLGLAILLLGCVFFLVYTNQPRSVEILTALTAIVSFIGVAFLGRAVIGAPNGIYCFLVLWSIIVIVGGYWFYRGSVKVARGQIVVVNRLVDSRVLVWREGFHRPLLLMVEHRIATLPAYELLTEMILENLNTQPLFNVDRVEVMVRYQVDEPRDVVFCIPNRELARDTLLRERAEGDTTEEQVAFWTELIQRQMKLEVEQVVRTVIANVAGPTEVSRKRDQYARQVRERLQQSVARWGIKLLELRFLDVGVANERVRAANRDLIIQREVQDAQRSAEIRAQEVELIGEAQARVTAKMVSELVATLKAQNVPLSVDEIERIVITAMQRSTDQQQLSGFFRDMSQNAASPPGGTTGPTTPLPNQPR